MSPWWPELSLSYCCSTPLTFATQIIIHNAMPRESIELFTVIEHIMCLTVCYFRKIHWRPRNQFKIEKGHTGKINLSMTPFWYSACLVSRPLLYRGQWSRPTIYRFMPSLGNRHSLRISANQFCESGTLSGGGAIGGLLISGPVGRIE